MVISYDFGHGSGQDRGANGIVNEEVEIRKYGLVVVNELIRQGHKLIDCTPSGNMTLNESLYYRVNKANSSGSQLHICFHANAFQSTNNAMGSEIEVASDNGAKYGESILKELVKLGFINRGVKRPQLYVTGHTSMTAILIEPFFVDSVADVKLYNPNTLGIAIAKGIVNIIGGNVVINATPQINYVLETQKLLNKLNIRDANGNKLVEDNIIGANTKYALNKLISKI